MSAAIRVAVRLKPLRGSERIDEHWEVDYDTATITCLNNTFYQDEVYPMSKTNSDVFEQSIQPMIDSAFNGINVAVLVYGQTSSGKTHTVRGSKKEAGILPLAVQEIFRRAEGMQSGGEYSFAVSYYQIYNEKISDMLNGSEKAKDLKVHSNNEGTAVIQDLTSTPVTCYNDVTQLLKQGDARRVTREHEMNATSSRSHAIFRMTLQSKYCDNANPGHKSTVTVVDLAGSERLKKTGARGLAAAEGVKINMSLLALGRVVQGLAERAQRTSCLAEQPTEAAQGTFEFEAELPAIPKLEGQGLEVRSSASTLPTKKESFLKRATSINKKKKKFRKRAESQDTVSVCSIASQPVNGSKSDHVPFRDSKLTRILEPSLTGNSLTLVVCAVSMSSTNRHETTSTLGFAANAKLIQCQPVVNKVAVSPRTQVKRLQSENEALKQRLQEAEAESSKAAETLAEEADQTAQAVRALELETSQKVKALETAAVARVQALEKALAEAKKISHQLPLNFKATTSMPKATDTSSDGAQASTSGGSPLLTRRRPTELYNHRERQNRSVTWAPHSHLRGEKRANSPLIKRRLSPTNGSLSGRSMPSPVAVRRAMAERDSDQRTLATPNGSTLEEGPNPSLGMLLRVKESGSEEIAAMTNDTQTGEDGVDNTGVADDTATRPVVADGLSGGSGDTCKTAEVGCTVEATVFSGTSVDGATRQTVGISDTGDVLSGLEASVSEVSIVTEMDNTSKDTEKVEDCDDETASVSFDLNGDGSEDVQEETVSKVRMEEIMENYKTRVVNRDNSRLRLISQLKETVAERDNQLTESGYAALSQKLSVAEGRIISISEQLSLTLVSLSEVQQKYEDAKEAAEDHATEIEAFRLEREEIIEKCKGVLDRQREKAKAATLKMHGIMRMEWEDDLRKSEMEQNILKCQIESEKETVAQLAEELKLSLEDYEYASEEYDKLVIELEEETDKVETLEAKCTKLKAMALELCDHYFACHERAMKEIEDHETDVKEADEREDKLREQIKSDAENRARILELEKKVDSFESKKQEYKAAYVSKSLQFDQLNEQFAALTEELITLQAQIAEKTGILDTTIVHEQHLRDRFTALSFEFRKSKNNVSTLTATLNERVEVYQAASLRCAALEEENSTLSRELQTSQVSLEDAQSKMERAQQELSKVRHELEQQKPVLETTRKAVRDRMGYQEKMMLAKFESTKKHVEKLERELEQVKKERANIIKDKGDVVTSLLIEKEKLETDLKRSKHMSDELMDRCEALEKVAKKPWYKRMGKEESNLLNTTTESLFG